MKYPNKIVSEYVLDSAHSDVVPSLGKYNYITCVMNASSLATSIDFRHVDDVNFLKPLKVPAQTAVSFYLPIRCKSFLPNSSSLTIIYYDGD